MQESQQKGGEWNSEAVAEMHIGQKQLKIDRIES